MPPKKKEEPKERPILGRFRSNLKASRSCQLHSTNATHDAPLEHCLHYLKAIYCVMIFSERPSSQDDRDPLGMQIGIVGLPNVGKSTLFNTITKMGIPAENFPFCTIEPNNVRGLPEGHACMHAWHAAHV